MIKQKINDFCRGTVRVIGIILVGYLFLQGMFTICCIQQIKEKVFYIQNNIVSQLIGIVLFALFVWLVMRPSVQKILKRYGTFLFAGALILMTIFLAFWISQTRFWFDADMREIFLSAEQMLQGDYSGWMPGGYVHMWPHQNGLALFVALLLKNMSVASAFTTIYCVNIVFYIITLISLYFSLRLLFREWEICCVQGLLLICYFPYGFYCTFMYGNVIGFGWACASIALVLWHLKNQKIVPMLGAALCMMMAIIFKQNEMLIFVGIVIILIFDWFNRETGKRKTALCAGMYMLIVLVGIRIPNLAVEHITGIEVQGNSKFAGLAMGLQEGDIAPGWNNNYDNDIFVENGYDIELTEQTCLASIKESWSVFLSEPEKGWKFFNYKFASEWNNPTFECYNIQNGLSTNIELSSLVKSVINDGGKLNILSIFWLDILQSALLFGILMYMIDAKEASWEQLLFVLLFIGGFIFFALWEARCQYVLPFFFLLIPYSFLGYKALLKKRRLWNVSAILAALIFVIAIADNSLINDSLKINIDTDSYYEYIHTYNHNFMNLRF